MANPQPDKFFKISVELFEAIMRTHFPGTARQVFDYVIRMTYGYHRKSFETTQHKIAKDLKLNKQRVNEAVLWLQNCKILNVTKNRDVLSRDCLTSFGIQKDFDLWETSRKNVTVRKSVTLTSRKTVITSSRKIKDKEHIIPNVTEKRDVKRFSPPSGKSLFDDGHSWIDAEAWDDFVAHRAEIRKPLSKLSVKKSLDLLFEHQSRQREIIDTTIRCRWQGLFPPKNSKFSKEEPDGPRLKILEPAP